MEGPRKECTAFVYVEGAIDEELLCPICHSPFLKPVQTVCCRACFCEDCISRTASCPLCRHSFGLGHGQKFQDTGRLVNNMVNRLKVRCSLCSAECERGDFEVHLQKQCPEKHSACSAHDVGCQAAMPQKNKQDHESACPFVAVRPCLLHMHNRMNKLEEEKQELDKRLLYQERELQNRIDKLERDKLRLENQLISVALDSQRQLTTQVEKLSRIFFHHSHYYERNLIRDTSFVTGDSVLWKGWHYKDCTFNGNSPAPSSSASASSSSPPSLLKKGFRFTESLCQVTLERCDLREADFRWCRMEDCTFRKCNLTGANFHACTLLNVSFSGCIGLDLTGATSDSSSQVL